RPGDQRGGGRHRQKPGNFAPFQRQRRQEGNRFHAEGFKPGRAHKEQAGEQGAQSGGKQGRDEIVPFHGAGDEAGKRRHLVQQRNHLVMGVQARAGGKGHRGGGGARDQQQYSVGGIAHGIG